MRIEITRKSELVTTNWSGGTTTQLAIYPSNSSYKEQNFLFRISTAKIEDQISEFTPLPGILRAIMILDGELILNHKNQYSKKIKKFECDHFKGNWKTTGDGKVIDFNLMMAENVSGTIEACTLEKNSSLSLELKNQVQGFYIFQGKIEITDYAENKFILNQGDFALLFNENKKDNLKIKLLEKTELIIPKIDLKL